MTMIWILNLRAGYFPFYCLVKFLEGTSLTVLADNLCHGFIENFFLRKRLEVHVFRMKTALETG